MTIKRPVSGVWVAVLIAAVVPAVSCAPPPQTDALRSSTSTGNVVTAEELDTLDSHDLLEVLRRLRPRWVRVHGSFTAKVYLNGSFGGGLDFLRDIPIESVVEMRFYETAEAYIRFGRSDDSGVIDVITTR